MTGNESEDEVFYFVQTISRSQRNLIPEYCGCFKECEQATQFIQTAENHLHKTQTSVYKVRLNARKVLTAVFKEPEIYTSDEDILPAFNDGQFHDFASFLNKYTPKEDIHIVQIKHHIR